MPTEKYQIKKTVWSWMNSERDIEEYRAVYEISNDSPRAHETITVILLSGPMRAEGVFNYRTNGGSLKFLPDQTEEQCRTRRTSHLKRGHAQEVYEVTPERTEAQILEFLTSEFGRMKGEHFMRAVLANLHYMKRVEDGSAVLAAEEFKPEELVQAKSVPHEFQPTGWGTW